MEREIECQTEALNLSEEINISEKINDLLVAYAKSIILHNPAKNDENEYVIKKKIYEWSKEYFKKLYDENEGKNTNLDNDCDVKYDPSATSTESNAIKDQIKKEMTRVNFNRNS
ncbi:hypothetical protein MKS88_003703 [Plasmodium brasilianum]|uniref:Uncharacterized protein n=2 Tax=Plasmodium (Plasmodium) TaxID=418103 RepID=A0A1A8WLZ4_PLAMA|nr:conserved Plasmodium protein, unknown function [Plasmodium malariae]KAI4837233.1 hypothetical protein MKS88_003703 [Plasmodium brasilianum]SBS92881.1 hypothetical protein, conserved [Plasmodium malariae]SCO93115.1 conserved Plasmodium protein, unknown function [Plasmodium malariae]